MFGQTPAGALKVVGATSFGEGCARAGTPGVYARVADSTLREWIARTPRRAWTSHSAHAPPNR
jgi:secreted trypsin-like serine protease